METTKDTGKTARRPGKTPPARKGRPAAKAPARKRPAAPGGKRPAQEARERAAAPSRRRPNSRKQPTAAQLRQKRRSAAASAAARRSTPLRPRRYDPDRPRVVYTPPKTFSRGHFLLRLATVVAVVLALTFGLSIFFKVEHINVAGAVKYDPWTVKTASGIELGDNLLTFGESKACARIKIALPYVDQVRIGIKLPDTVNIEIKEFDMLYSLRDASDQWWLITADGTVVEQVDSAAAGERTRVLGVRLASPTQGQQAVAQEDMLPEPTEGTGPTTPPVTVRGSDRLSAALTILRHLEECGILGQIASVDVSDLGNLELWYGTRFQVKLGDTTQLAYKIKCMNAAINGTDPNNTLKEYDSGMLDVSFTIKPDQLIYQTFTD